MVWYTYTAEHEIKKNKLSFNWLISYLIVNHFICAHGSFSGSILSITQWHLRVNLSETALCVGCFHELALQTKLLGIYLVPAQSVNMKPAPALYSLVPAFPWYKSESHINTTEKFVNSSNALQENSYFSSLVNHEVDYCLGSIVKDIEKHHRFPPKTYWNEALIFSEDAMSYRNTWQTNSFIYLLQDWDSSQRCLQNRLILNSCKPWDYILRNKHFPAFWKTFILLTMDLVVRTWRLLIFFRHADAAFWNDHSRQRFCQMNLPYCFISWNHVRRTQNVLAFLTPGTWSLS